MNHYINQIEQDPPSGGEAFDVMRSDACLFQFSDYCIGYAAHVSVRGP